MKRISAIAAALLVVASPVRGQLAVEIEAGGGYTLVDVESIAFNDGSIAQEWNQPNYRFAVRAMAGGDGMRLGAEVSHQYLYWYSVRIPFGSTPILREYDVSATSVLGLARLGGGGASLDLGAGVAFLDDPVAALSVAVGWEVVNRLVVKLRADGLLASEATVPVGLAFSYALTGS